MLGFAWKANAGLPAERRVGATNRRRPAQPALEPRHKPRGASAVSSSNCPAAPSPPATRPSSKAQRPQHAVANGDRGTITHVDTEHQRLTVRIANRQVELDRGFLLDTTRQGGPTLQHGYALTCHVAQGLTSIPRSCSPTPAFPRSSRTPRSRAGARPTTSTSPNSPTGQRPNTHPSSRPRTRSSGSPPCWPPAARVRARPCRGRPRSRNATAARVAERRDVETSKWTPRRGQRLVAAQRA